VRLKRAVLPGVVVVAASCVYLALFFDARSATEEQQVPVEASSPDSEAFGHGGLVAPANPVDFGRAFDDQAVSVTLGLRNTGPHEVRILHVRSGCGCVRVGSVPEVLAPGAEAEIGFAVRLAGRSGRFSKSVRFLSDDPVAPELRVRIEGEVLPRLIVEPRRAVVPAAAPGTERMIGLAVRSGAGESLGELTAISSVPGVAVTTTVEGTSARLRVTVSPDVARVRGTITLRLGRYEKVVRLTDASSEAGGAANASARRPRSGARGSRRGTGTARQVADSLAVVFTGQDLGQMEPCGCSAGMLGGLSRRHARIRAFFEPGDPFLLLSGGGLVAGADEYDRLRFEAIVEALQATSFDAIAPARHEIALGARVPGSAPARTRPRMVAADIDPARVADRDIAPMVQLKSGDVQVCVTGVAGPAGYALPSEVRRARKALRRLRADLAESEPMVVLANVDEAAARDLAKYAGYPTIILYAGGVTDPGPEDVVEGPVAIAPFPAEGKYVGLARLVGKPRYRRWWVEYRPIEAELPEDQAIVALRKAHLERMRAADLVAAYAGQSRFTPHALSDEPPPAPEGAARDRYVGSGACAECHEAESRAWTDSRHARAMHSLRATGDDADPGCVACHVVGYGTGRGFTGEKATPHLAEVGCEACHGPRGLHVDFHGDSHEATKESPRESVALKGRAACAACHDAKHDPDFEFDTYWPRIAHGSR
jgi:hypothetical protein